MVVCTCARTNLCERCYAFSLATLTGHARARGWAWADRVARRAALDQPWPTHKERAAVIARAQVADLSEDPRLLEVLARACAEEAAAQWERKSAAAHDH